MRFWSIRSASLASCLLLVACGDDGAEPCDLWIASAVVSGSVTDSAGAPIVGATVEAQVDYFDPCDGAENWVQPKRVITDASGMYSAKLELGNSSGMRCVRVTEVESGVSFQGDVEFVGECGDTRPPGQLKADLVIP